MISLRLQNVGPGAARLQSFGVTYARNLTPPKYVRVETSRVVAPGQLTLLNISSDDEPADAAGWLTSLLDSNEDLIIETAYTDIAGRQGTATRLRIRKSNEGVCRVVDVDALVAPQLLRLRSE